jgi:hypothetical protein
VAGGHRQVAEALARLGGLRELPRGLEDALHAAPPRQRLRHPGRVRIVAEYRGLVVARAVAAVPAVAYHDLVLVARRRLLEKREACLNYSRVGDSQYSGNLVVPIC